MFTTLTKEAMPVIRYGPAISRASAPSRAAAAARSSGWRRSRAARTTCSSSEESTSFQPRSSTVLGQVGELSPHYQLVVSRKDARRARGTDRGDGRLLPGRRGRAAERRGDRRRPHASRRPRSRHHLIKDTIGCTMQVTLAAPIAAALRRRKLVGLGHAAARLGARRVMSGWAQPERRREGAAPGLCCMSIPPSSSDGRRQLERGEGPRRCCTVRRGGRERPASRGRAARSGELRARRTGSEIRADDRSPRRARGRSG